MIHANIFILLFSKNFKDGSWINSHKPKIFNQKKFTIKKKLNSSELKKEIFSEFIKVSNNVNAPIRKFGSAALDMAYVACGRFDGYWQRELMYWDIAAGIIILKEAGGFVNFFENNNAIYKCCVKT